jgi:prepilin-type processing-associated H-X9-DG protein
MQLPSDSSNGGTMEFNLTGEVWRHFRILSNELSTPKVLACASDAARQPVSSFDEFTNNSHLSYFVGLDATEFRPQTILAGDRNLTSTMIKSVKGVLNLATNDSVEWSKAMHNQAGNIALADGSVSQATAMQLNRQFQAAINSTTQAVYRIALPE